MHVIQGEDTKGEKLGPSLTWRFKVKSELLKPRNGGRANEQAQRIPERGRQVKREIDHNIQLAQVQVHILAHGLG